MADEDLEEERPKADPPPPLGVPEWMVTYGDMMTLLLCFFVLLFIFAKSEEYKQRAVLGSIQDAFGMREEPNSPFNTISPLPSDSTTATQLSQAAQEMMEEIQENIMASPEAKSLEQALIVDTENKGLVLRIYSADLFKPHGSELSDKAPALLKPVADAINRHQFNVLVRTNVTQKALADSKHSSTWELSSSMAGAAAQGLITYGGIKPTRLKAMGMGDTGLVVPPSDPKSESYNNRTDFVFYLPGTEYW